MAIASDNPYPSVLIRESADDGSDFSNPASDYRRLFLGEDGELHLKDSAGAVTDVGGGAPGGGGGLLAVNKYAPTTLTIYSATTATLTDVDATNMKVTFTAPASGNVLIRCNAYADMNSAAGEGFWGLRESTTDLSGIVRVQRQSDSDGYLSVSFYFTGVSGGSHTYKWAFATSAGSQTHRIIIQDGSAVNEWGPGIMEVWEAP